MMSKVIIFPLFFLILSSSCLKSQQTTIDSKSGEVSKYLNKVSKSSKIPQDKFFYVTKESDKNLLKKIQPSVITFVKGNKTAVIDSLKLPQDENVVGLNSSCGLDDITKEVVEYNLKTYPNIDYGAMILKNISNRSSFTFPQNKTTAVMLYSKKMGIFARQYTQTVKRLKEEFGIDYILVTMDGQDLKEIEDIYYDSFDNRTKVSTK